VQTEESVRIRKSDLESWKTVEGMDPEQMPAPEEVKPKELMDLTSSNGAKPGVDGTPPPLGSVLAEAKDNLEKFIESLHKKAAQAMSWVTSLEPPALENPTVKQKAPLGSYVVANIPTSLLFAIFFVYVCFACCSVLSEVFGRCAEDHWYFGRLFPAAG